VVPQGLMVSLSFSLFGDFQSFLGDFLVVDLRLFSWGFGWGCMHEPVVVLFLVTPSQIREKRCSILEFS
jgi:hypothetical protein